jgi:hypothetical protein
MKELSKQKVMTTTRTYHQFHPNNSDKHNRAQVRIANLLEKHGYETDIEVHSRIVSATPLGPKSYQWDIYGEKKLHRIVMPSVATLEEYESIRRQQEMATRRIAVEIRNKDSKTKWGDYKRSLKTDYTRQQGVRIFWVDVNDVVGKKKISDEQLAIELEL